MLVLLGRVAGAPEARGAQNPESRRGARPLLNSQGVYLRKWSVVEWIVWTFDYYVTLIQLRDRT